MVKYLNIWLELAIFGWKYLNMGLIVVDTTLLFTPISLCHEPILWRRLTWFASALHLCIGMFGYAWKRALCVVYNFTGTIVQRGPCCQWFKLSQQANTVLRSGSHTLVQGYLVNATQRSLFKQRGHWVTRPLLEILSKYTNLLTYLHSADKALWHK